MPTTREVSAKSPKLEMESVAFVNVPETLDEAEEMYGGEAVLSNALANWCVTLQAGIRRMHVAGKTDEEIQIVMGEAKMGVATSGGRVDPIQASLAKFKTMNPEEQADYLEKLKAAAAAG